MYLPAHQLSTWDPSGSSDNYQLICLNEPGIEERETAVSMHSPKSQAEATLPNTGNTWGWETRRWPQDSWDVLPFLSNTLSVSSPRQLWVYNTERLLLLSARNAFPDYGVRSHGAWDALLIQKTQMQSSAAVGTALREMTTQKKTIPYFTPKSSSDRIFKIKEDEVVFSKFSNSSH